MKNTHPITKYIRGFTLLFFCTLTLTSTAAFAGTGFLDWIACDIEEIAYNLRIAVYVIAALGMMGIAVTAFVGKFRWGWVFSWAFGVFLLGAIEGIINLLFGDPTGCNMEHDDMNVYSGGLESIQEHLFTPLANLFT
ncbi:MAG: hypothetical protein ACTSXQ_05225 [Alphaproteobacteria bacterium]